MLLNLLFKTPIIKFVIKYYILWQNCNRKYFNWRGLQSLSCKEVYDYFYTRLTFFSSVAPAGKKDGIDMVSICAVKLTPYYNHVLQEHNIFPSDYNQRDSIEFCKLRKEKGVRSSEGLSVPQIFVSEELYHKVKKELDEEDLKKFLRDIRRDKETVMNMLILPKINSGTHFLSEMMGIKKGGQ